MANSINKKKSPDNGGVVSNGGTNKENNKPNTTTNGQPSPICRAVRRPDPEELRAAAAAANYDRERYDGGAGPSTSNNNGNNGIDVDRFSPPGGTSAWDTMSVQFQLCERHLEEKDSYCRDCTEEICGMCLVDQHKAHKIAPGMTAQKLFDDTERVLRLLDEDQASVMAQKRRLHCRRTSAKQDIQMFMYDMARAVQRREHELLTNVDQIYECRMRIVEQRIRDMRTASVKGEKLSAQMHELRRQNRLDALFRQTRFLRKHTDDMRTMHYECQKRDENLTFVPPDAELVGCFVKMGSIKHHSQIAVESFNGCAASSGIGVGGYGFGGGASNGGAVVSNDNVPTFNNAFSNNYQNGFDWSNGNGNGGRPIPEPFYGTATCGAANGVGAGSSFDTFGGLLGHIVSTATTTMANNTTSSYQNDSTTAAAAAAFSQQQEQYQQQQLQQQQQQPAQTPTLNQIMSWSLHMAQQQQLNATTPDSYNLPMLPFIGGGNKSTATTPCHELSSVPMMTTTTAATIMTQPPPPVFQSQPPALPAPPPPLSSPQMEVAVPGDNGVAIITNGSNSGGGVDETLFSMGFHTSRNYNRIRKPVVVFGQEGSGDEDLCRPWGVYCDRRGHVLVADRSNNRITVFTSDGTHIRHFGRPGNGEGELNRPAGVAVDPWGRVIVADKDNHRIQVFSMEGKFLFMFGEKGSRLGQFHYPWDVDVNARGILAVTDTRNHRVQFFKPNQDYYYEFHTKFGYETASHMWRYFDAPRGCCFTPEGTLIVTDFNNHRLNEVWIDERIRIGPPEYTQPPRLIKSDHYKKCDLFRPQGVTIDLEGNILVADCRNNRIQVFNREAELVGTFGCLGKELGQFDRPSGIATTPDGKIAVVDFGNHRVQIF